MAEPFLYPQGREQESGDAEIDVEIIPPEYAAGRIDLDCSELRHCGFIECRDAGDWERKQITVGQFENHSSLRTIIGCARGP